MRIGILGDVHSNLEALDAVLGHFSRNKVDRIVAVGDLVGYGADPSAVLAVIRKEGVQSVIGNHDAAIAETLVDPAYFNAFARAAATWTRKSLSGEELAFLAHLPLIHLEDEFVIVHGSMQVPEEFNYVQTPRDAMQSMGLQQRPVCFVGHSHLPGVFLERHDDSQGVDVVLSPRVELDGFKKALVNVGSVGQPRDEDPRAVAAIFDSEARVVTLDRVPYDIDRAAAKILAAGLPRMLAERLRFGI